MAKQVSPETAEAVRTALRGQSNDAEHDALAAVAEDLGLDLDAPYYWLTLVISSRELADRLDCEPDEIEAQDYLGAIRDYGEISKCEVIES